jgi:predicted transcriptional regulator
MMIKMPRDAVRQAEIEAPHPCLCHDEDRAAVRRGLAEADRGEFVPDELVAEANKRHDQ